MACRKRELPGDELTFSGAGFFEDGIPDRRHDVNRGSSGLESVPLKNARAAPRRHYPVVVML